MRHESALRSQAHRSGEMGRTRLLGVFPFVTAALSVASGTISGVPRDAAVEKPSLVLVSHTGVPLSRSTTFRFTLDPNREQHQRLLAHGGAARLAYNHHIGRARPTST